nr:MAG TPA: hypothetical protein [Caudoviricetes sp.]
MRYLCRLPCTTLPDVLIASTYLLSIKLLEKNLLTFYR